MHDPNPKVDKLVGELAAIDQERMAIKERGQKIKAKLEEALLEEQAVKWGLTTEEYKVAKTKAGELTRAQGTLLAAQTQIKKLAAKSKSAKFSEEDRKRFAEAMATLESKLPALEKAVNDANQEPLTVHLNRARTAKGMGVKNAQTAKAGALGTK